MPRLLMGFVLVGVLAVVLVSCGSAKRSSGRARGSPVVAVVGGAAITKSDVRHWMTALSLSAARERAPHISESPAQQALSFLITSHWLVDEAHRRELGVTAREVDRALEQQEGTYTTHSEFTDFLKSAGRIVSDLRFELEAALAFAALRRDLAQDEPKAPAPSRRALDGFLARWTGRWKAQTDCRVGYVVNGCRQHPGPVAIEYPISVNL